jgi:uridine kinase
MLKITIEGPQGCGKTTIANIIKKVIESSKLLRFMRPVAMYEPDYLTDKNPTRPKTKIIIDSYPVFQETALTVAKKMVLAMDRKQLLALKRHVEVFLM